MQDKAYEVIREYEELLNKIESPETYSDPLSLKNTTSRLSELKEKYKLSSQYIKLKEEISEAEEIRDNNPEEKNFANNIITHNSSLLNNIENLLKKAFSKLDVNKSSAIIEIRAGSGGEEASIFVGDLFEMYSKFCNNMDWQLSIMSANEGAKGGFKEVVFIIENDNSYPRLVYESGVHRVQRVPETESSGRIHTSAASVVVYPLSESKDLVIDPSEIEISTYRSSGPGGQSVNTTDSAVRIRHIPTDITVTCQDNKSQHKNKDQAMTLLKSKLADLQSQQEQSEVDTVRKSAIKSGDRSDKIRTYNYPQSRVTDHRINKSWHNLENIMNGDIEELLKDVSEGMSDIDDN